MGASWGATTVVVGTPSCSAAASHPLYSSIQTAVDSVPIGSTIEVCPGVYPEQVTINKNITLKGVPDKNSSTDAAVIAVPPGTMNTIADVEGGQPIAAQLAVLNGATVALSNITVDGSGNNIQSCAIDLVGVLFQNSSGSLKQSSVVNQILPPDYVGCQGGLAVFAQTDGTHSASVTISGNDIANFDKNGITVDNTGLNATISDNTVTGIGATDLIAQNGIQVSYGAGGSVTNNRVADSVYSPNTYGSSGILVYLSSGVTVTGNTITNTQYAVAVVGDGAGTGDHATIDSNAISRTVFWDAIDLCASSNNTVSSNDIRGTGEAAIHVEGSTFCGSASTGNTLSKNAINAACAGVLAGPGSGYHNSKPKYYNVVNETLATPDDSCPTGGAQAARRGEKHASHVKVSPAHARVART
jgi:hypothetical protein